MGPKRRRQETFFNLISAVFPAPPPRETILFDGRDCDSRPAASAGRLGWRATFQITEIFPEADGIRERPHQHEAACGLGCGRGFQSRRKSQGRVASSRRRSSSRGSKARPAGSSVSSAPATRARRRDRHGLGATAAPPCCLDEPTAGWAIRRPTNHQCTAGCIATTNFTIVLIENDMRVVFHLAIASVC